MTTPNEQAPSTRSEWLALIREAVRAEFMLRDLAVMDAAIVRAPDVRDLMREACLPQPPSEG